MYLWLNAFLLSREWYILDKSKSVKAFRCGEYDSHIDKAKAAAAARASKKRTAKFTRREIAIHIALEIENSHLLKQDDHHSEAEDGLGSAPDPTISFQETNNVGALVKVQQPKRRRTPNDSEDEGIKRMRGLEDIGKEHVGDIVVFNNNRQDVRGLNSAADSLSNGDKASSPLSLKRKRSQVINATECSSKKKNRRRQLTKVLESTAVVSDQLVTSGMEPVESMKSVSAVINNSSDSTCENASENVVGASHYNKAKDSDISSLSVSAEEDDDPSDQLHDVPLIGNDNHSAGISCLAHLLSAIIVCFLNLLLRIQRHDDLLDLVWLF